MGVVKLQHQCQMLAGSVQNLNTNRPLGLRSRLRKKTKIKRNGTINN